MKTLHDAVKERDHVLIRKLVRAGYDPNALNDEGVTPAFAAVSFCCLEVLETLVSVGAKIDAPNASGVTPLFHAANWGDLTGIALLIKKFGANSNAADRQGATPIYHAAIKGQVGAIELLFSLGARVDVSAVLGRTPLHFAAQYGQVGAVRALVSIDASLLYKRCNDGTTPLEIAVQYGQAGVIRALAELGADVKERMGHGETFIFIAAKCGHAKAILQLAALGVDPKAPNKSGYTPLMTAAEQGHVEVVSALVCCLHVPVDTPMADGITALHIAVLGGNVPLVRELRRLGANPYSSSKTTSELFSFAIARHDGDALLAALLENPNYKALRDLYLTLQLPEKEPKSPFYLWTEENRAKFRAVMEWELPRVVASSKVGPKLFCNYSDAPKNMSSAVFFKPAVASDENRDPQPTAPKLSRGRTLKGRALKG
jgi:ankyrin repeat protein